MTLATNATGEVIETGFMAGRVFIRNQTTGQRVEFPVGHALSVAIAMSEYVPNDDDRGFVRHHWGDLELDNDEEW